MIKAIIFDFDGTILDTESAWYEALRAEYEAHGAELTLETFSKCIGTSLDAFNPYEYINTLIQEPVDPVRFKQAVRERHRLIMKQVVIRPGIESFLQSAKEAGLRIGLASSSERSWIDRYLKPLGIEDYFECIRTSDHVAKVKPDPELYVQALECLGVEPHEAIAIEDSANGSLAAIAAGMHCLVVPNPATRFSSFHPSCLMAECLSDVDFAAVVADPASLAAAKR
ncbi:HAD family hydrolase [Paenibacillus protaetiae]|uniref:HAD family hydrolase n=1 Tax=Paenibacillus protaetiae TaxID=2509456 RepID=A0A4P6EQV0_9BACL|nr:HAD family hydrolase [Paenibacillus protaetiae]QAY65222.1 HAD family hydrolase [Paenibacillus protaetiae]